ncbi:MAG TPA: ATP-binding protein, partial [Methylomirabilota bacterium]|nr:ATP-binding protein [Methylomirabilota bacterium]
LHHPEADPDPPRTLIEESQNPAESMVDRPMVFFLNGRDKWRYTPAERLLYSYRVGDREWSPFLGSAVITLRDLRPGSHRLEVRTMDRNLNVDPEPGVFEFSVLVPWYQETRLVVISLMALVVVVFFAGLAFNRHRRLGRSYAEVERIVALRTRQLEQANEVLLHSQKMNALGTLAAGIAHDFNNILSIIKGSAQIIEAHPRDTDKVHTRVNRIKTVVDQGAAIVKTMLGFSRNSDHKAAPCQVEEIVAETVGLLGDRFTRGMDLKVEAEPGLPAVMGVKDHIQQMLLNLIFNAADAMDHRGEVVLRIGRMKKVPGRVVLPPAAAEEYVFLSVVDHGCGITPEILTRIFEPFFTTKALSSRRGTGLGLSMVYELAANLGFGLMVVSETGKGSTFTLILPAASGAQERVTGETTRGETSAPG